MTTENLVPEPPLPTLQRRGDGCERTITVKHIVFAIGFGLEESALPTYPGMDSFKGQIYTRTSIRTQLIILARGFSWSVHLHLLMIYALTAMRTDSDVTIHQRSSTYVMSTTDGWKVVAQGNHSSSYFTVRTNSLDLGAYLEGGRPTDIADRLGASFPNHVTVGLAQRQTKDIVELDKFCLHAQIPSGIDWMLSVLLGWLRLGGYYLDASASQLIVDGKTKLKSGSQLERLTETGVKFEDGPERKRKLGVNELRFEPARLMIE
ncbi:Flavin-containing monooxygenase YUCCA3 [Termitomyces sp. T112]|nr:Flavin-containing monooxygenase YUCCA3 [Termitomyces sp. T112]